MIKKEQLQEILKKLPEEFSLGDFMDKLILLNKIEIADKQSTNGQTITESELEIEMKRWFK